MCGWGAFIASCVTVIFNGHVRRLGSTVRYTSTGAKDHVTVPLCCLYKKNHARTAAPATMAMPTSTPTTNDRKRKRDLSVSTSGFIPPTNEQLKHLPPSPGEWVHMQKQQSELGNPFHSDSEDDDDPKSPDYTPESPTYSPVGPYNTTNDQKISFEGISFVGNIDDSEENSVERDDSALERKWVQHVLPGIKHMIPEEVMRAFLCFIDMLDENGECFKVREKFEEFWEAFVCYLDREENYDTSKMDENKGLKEEIKKYFEIIGNRYDDEKRCEQLGILLRSFDALNDDEDDEEEKIEFSKENLLNHFRLDNQKGMYGDVTEKDVEKVFNELSKVRNG